MSPINADRTFKGSHWYSCHIVLYITCVLCIHIYTHYTQTQYIYIYTHINIKIFQRPCKKSCSGICLNMCQIFAAARLSVALSLHVRRRDKDANISTICSHIYIYILFKIILFVCFRSQKIVPWTIICHKVIDFIL